MALVCLFDSLFPNLRLVASSSAPRSSSNTTVIFAVGRPSALPTKRTAAGAATVAPRAPFAPPAAPFLPLDIA